MKKRTWGVRIAFVLGFLICSFPLIHNIIGQRRQADAVATYQRAADQETEESRTKARSQAEEYNTMLYQSGGAIVDDMDTDLLSDKSYQQQLDLTGTGVMGSIDIPKINVNLPVYHGTGESALSNGAGHIQGTSLPIGGINTHCVLTGHRGLPSSKLFVRLDELKKGDLFFLRTLSETLAYKVSAIETVKPEDMSHLKIQPDRDLVSLVTCTPYGINTQRLIVTGKRVAYKETEHDQIKAAIPSVRELVFTVLPFVFAAASIALSIKNRRCMVYEDHKI